MKFSEIFPEYFALYRGQGRQIPAEGSPEWETAIQLANNSIRKWATSDATLWKELYTTLQTEQPQTISGATYDIDNMQRPPGFINFIDSSDNRTKLRTIEPHQALDYDGNSLRAYFLGNPNRGYTLHIDGTLTDISGHDLDFPYLKQPTLMEDGDSVPEMSDVNYMIQDMLAARFVNTRNYNSYNIHRNQATIALANMKLINNTGDFGNTWNLKDGDGAKFGPGRAQSFFN